MTDSVWIPTAGAVRAARIILHGADSIDTSKGRKSVTGLATMIDIESIPTENDVTRRRGPLPDCIVAMTSALRGVLHHDSATKDSYKLSPSLIAHVRRALATIPTDESAGISDGANLVK